MIDKSMRVHLGHTIAGNLKDFGDTAYPPYIPEDYALTLVAEALQPWVDFMADIEGVVGLHLPGYVAELGEIDMPKIPEDAIAARAKRDADIRRKALEEVGAWDRDLIERMACAMWRQDAFRAGTPSVAQGRTASAFRDQSHATRAVWLERAEAALSCIGKEASNAG